MYAEPFLMLAVFGGSAGVAVLVWLILFARRK
jgi:hypothetical protein